MPKYKRIPKKSISKRNISTKVPTIVPLRPSSQSVQLSKTSPTGRSKQEIIPMKSLAGAKQVFNPIMQPPKPQPTTSTMTATTPKKSGASTKGKRHTKASTIKEGEGGDSLLALKVAGGIAGAAIGGASGGIPGAISGAKKGAGAVDKVTDLIEYAAGGPSKREDDLADRAIKLAQSTHDKYQHYKGKFDTVREYLPINN